MGLHMLFDYTSEDGTTLSAGEPVTVVQADGDGWALVQTANDTMIWAPFDFVSKPAPAPLPDQGDYAHLTLSANPDYRAPAEHVSTPAFVPFGCAVLKVHKALWGTQTTSSEKSIPR